MKIIQLGAEDFRNVSFPLLTEITDFLVVYRVSGLKSVSQLFPNLVRIHGQSLFKGYALVLFENPNLEAIDLQRLKSIAKGGVRVEGNEMLCYVHTVNWTMIEGSKDEDNHIQVRFKAFR